MEAETERDHKRKNKRNGKRNDEGKEMKRHEDTLTRRKNSRSQAGKK